MTETELKGDPSKLIKAVEPDSIGADGSYREGNPNNFAALGKEADILEALRQRGWSEAALTAFKSGKSITRNKMRPDQSKPEAEIILDEKWDGKKEEEGY